MPQIPFRGKPPADRYMEPEEFQKLLQVARKDLDVVRAIVLMGFGGLRTIEALHLKVGNLDPHKRGVWAWTAKRKDHPDRFIPLEQWYVLFSKSARGRKAPEQLLLRGRHPMQRRQLRYLFVKYRDRAGIRHALGPHSLRHLAGTARSEAGASPQELAAFLGHKTLDMVLVYANLRHERNAQITKGAADILFGKSVTNPDK